MNISDELYREVILDHYKNPRHHGTLDGAQIVQEGANPLCGDELRLSLTFENGKLKDVAFEGHGCSISQASASMMSEAIHQQPAERIRKMVGDFKGMMLENLSADDLPPELEDAKSLEGVKKYPVRIKCALLAWNTLLEALKKVPA